MLRSIGQRDRLSRWYHFVGKSCWQYQTEVFSSCSCSTRHVVQHCRENHKHLSSMYKAQSLLFRSASAFCRLTIFPLGKSIDRSIVQLGHVFVSPGVPSFGVRWKARRLTPCRQKRGQRAQAVLNLPGWQSETRKRCCCDLLFPKEQVSKFSHPSGVVQDSKTYHHRHHHDHHQTWQRDPRHS